MDAAPEATLRSLNPAKGCGGLAFERLQFVGPAVGERLFRESPDAFVGVQLRRVGREVDQVEAWEASAHLADSVALVDARVVPDDDHVATQVAKEMREEFADLVVTDVSGIDSEVQAHALSFR